MKGNHASFRSVCKPYEKRFVLILLLFCVSSFHLSFSLYLNNTISFPIFNYYHLSFFAYAIWSFLVSFNVHLFLLRFVLFIYFHIFFFFQSFSSFSFFLFTLYFIHSVVCLFCFPLHFLDLLFRMFSLFPTSILFAFYYFLSYVHFFSPFSFLSLFLSVYFTLCGHTVSSSCLNSLTNGCPYKRIAQ